MATINTDAAQWDYMKCYEDNNNRHRCPIYLEVSLKKGNTVLDKRCIPVQLETGAVLKVQKDGIRAIVGDTGGSTVMGWVQNNYSTKDQTSEEISSTVTSQMTNYYTKEETYSKSEMEQKANSIALNVYSKSGGVTGDDLKRTGIDIVSGKIELTADNTNINGNLNIYNANEGLQIYEGTTPKISILKRNLGSDPTAMTDYKDIYFYKEIILKPGESTFDFGNLSDSKIDFGTFINNTTVTLSDFSWNVSIKLSEDGVNGWYGGKNELSSSNRKFTWSGPSNLSGSVTSYGNISSLNKSFTSTGAHEYMNITQLSGTVTGDGVSKYCKIGATVKGKVKFVNNSGLLVGQDAISICSPTENRYVLVNPDNFIIRNGKNIFRIKDGHIQRNDQTFIKERTGAEMGGTYFGDISSILPYKGVNTLTYNATVNDGIIIVRTIPGNESGRTVYLPKPDHAPIGKIYYIKNGTTNPCTVRISGNVGKLMAAADNGLSDNHDIKSKSMMYVNDGMEWIAFYCG